MLHPGKVALIVGVFCICVEAKAEIQLDLVAAGYGHLTEKSIGLSTELTPTLSLGFKKHNLDISSVNEFQLFTPFLSGEGSSFEWYSYSQLDQYFDSTNSKASVRYDHQDFTSSIDIDVVTTDELTFTLGKLLTNKQVVSRNVLFTAQKSIQSRIDEQSESNRLALTYGTNRTFKSDNSIGAEVTYSNLLNGIETIDGNFTILNPYRDGVLAISAGMNRADSNYNNSSLVTGGVEWKGILSQRLSYQLQIGRTRTIAKSLLISNGVDSGFEADQLVDTDMAGVEVSWSHPSENLILEFKYQYSWINSVFEVQAIQDVGQQQVDTGILDINYSFNQITSLHMVNGFTFAENKFSYVGDLEFNRELTRKFKMTASIEGAYKNSDATRLTIGLVYSPFAESR